MKAKTGKTITIPKTCDKYGVAQMPPAAGSRLMTAFMMA